MSALGDRAHRAVSLLEQSYGSPRHGNKDEPLDELVFILLSQMTTHQSFNRVFDRLKREIPNWSGLLNTSVSKLAELISDAGLSQRKAERLKAIVERLVDDFGVVSLSPLSSMTDEEAERYLTDLPGIGIKTAKCILMYSFGREVLPVDTHVWRVARRLGLVSERVPYSRVHTALEQVVAPKDRYALHVNSIPHGRAVCIAKTPRCKSCSLADLCDYRRRTR